MSPKARIAVLIGATLLFLVAGLGLRWAQDSLDEIGPKARDPELSAKMLQDSMAHPEKVKPEADSDGFDWRALPFILLGVGAMIALVGTMVFVIGKAMPDALSAPDAEDTGSSGPAFISQSRS